jgi:twitching motility protein PilJ
VRTLILSLAATFAAALSACSNDNCETIVAAGRLQLLAQRMPYDADNALAANLDSFKQLKYERESAAPLLARLRSAGLDGGVAQAWAKLDSDIGKVLDREAAIKSMAEHASDLGAKLPVLNSRMDDVVKLLAEGRDGTKAQVMMASRCMRLLDRITRRIQSVTNGGEEAQAETYGLVRDWQFYRAVVTGLQNGNTDLGFDKMANATARTILGEIDAQANTLDDDIKAIVTAGSQVQDTRQAADASHIDGNTVVLKAESLAAVRKR